MVEGKWTTTYRRKRYDGEFTYTEWITEEELLADIAKSTPPSGKRSVTNVYVDPATGKLVVEYDDGLT
jgi:hypothetical protein